MNETTPPPNDLHAGGEQMPNHELRVVTMATAIEDNAGRGKRKESKVAKKAKAPREKSDSDGKLEILSGTINAAGEASVVRFKLGSTTRTMTREHVKLLADWFAS